MEWVGLQYSPLHLHPFSIMGLSDWVSLSSPLGYTTSITLRFRTRERDGVLVTLASQDGRDSLVVSLVGGRACLVLRLAPRPPSPTLYGTATFLSVDEGEGALYNASVSLEGRQLLEVNRKGGVTLGEPPPTVTTHRGTKPHGQLAGIP
ncbi:hypothetical protein Pmani_033724 [Petrolisthes manimaculis]|uniref:Uncharacterized protein n=1 Tax=Petrolisthes manimaculis TaxID=1843537 RepID=A0AAE1TSC4_9EUCA|nr:hypothetical protein Pmani_033724 [Petrolisthes manimaculis]